VRGRASDATVTACSESWPGLVLAVKSGAGLALEHRRTSCRHMKPRWCESRFMHRYRGATALFSSPR
jgi:hypothetical protein